MPTGPAQRAGVIERALFAAAQIGEGRVVEAGRVAALGDPRSRRRPLLRRLLGLVIILSMRGIEVGLVILFRCRPEAAKLFTLQATFLLPIAYSAHRFPPFRRRRPPSWRYKDFR